MLLSSPSDTESLFRSGKKIEAMEEQARELARSVETLRQQALVETHESIEALDQKARDLAEFVESTRQRTLLQTDKKIEALEQKARDLEDLVERLRSRTLLQSDDEIALLWQKARDLAVSVEAVRQETQLQSTAEITALGKKARDLAASVEAVREKTLLQSDAEISVLKQMEESLRTSQARLNSTLAAGLIGTWTWDIPNDRLTADEFTARMFSIEPNAAAKGLPAAAYLRAVSEEDQPHVSDALARAIQTCGCYDIEYRVRQKGGGFRWLQAKGRVEGDAAGNAVNFHGAVMDITARKRTEGRLRRLVDSNLQGVMFWNTKGAITEANDAFLRIVGYSREDLVNGRIDWMSMTPPEYAHLDRSALEELASKGIGTPFEKEYFRKDGSRVPILLGAATFEDNPEEGICFLLDITERKRTDRALRESEGRLRFLNELAEETRTLADPAQIMAVSARMLGQYLKASRCAYADVENDSERFTILHDFTDGCASTVGEYQLSLFGTRAVATLLSGQTLIVRNVDEELLPDDGADMFNAIGIKAIITCPLVKDGDLRAMMAVHQTTPRDWKSTEIAIVQDVVERCWATIERRVAEEKNQQLNAELEQRIHERTGQLEAANRELEAFSYSVSHDLRAPLRALDGFSQALLQNYADKLDDQGRHYLQRVRAGTQRMGQLIDDLLKLSRMTRNEMQCQPVNLTALAQTVTAELCEREPGRTITFNARTGLNAECDPHLIRVVLENLLGNAWKFTAKNPAATIVFEQTEVAGKPAFVVRDDGAGFDMAYVGKLFGAFQRLHSDKEFLGTGIGLATVQRIIRRHGGEAWAEGAVGRGAAFYFTLPGSRHTP